MLPSRPVRRDTSDSEDCEIEIKRTAQGQKIRFKGKCSKEQIDIARRNAGISSDDVDID